MKFRVFDKEGNIIASDVRLSDVSRFAENEEYMVVRSLGMEYKGDNVYERDTIHLSTTDVDDNNGFWASNVGRMMKEKGFTELVLAFDVSPFLAIEYKLYFRKNGKWATQSDYDGEESEDETVFYTSGDGPMFPRYLLQKGAIVATNTVTHPGIVPST